MVGETEKEISVQNRRKELMFPQSLCGDTLLCSALLSHLGLLLSGVDFIAQFPCPHHMASVIEPFPCSRGDFRLILRTYKITLSTNLNSMCVFFWSSPCRSPLGLIVPLEYSRNSFLTLSSDKRTLAHVTLSFIMHLVSITRV